MSADVGVIGTNDDASSCKRFAVEKKYWHDPYISMLIPRTSGRKAPEINRGYYARVTAIQRLTEKFLRLTNKNCQIVNLGAGFDTMFWKIHEADLVPKSFVEVDFEQVTARKCHFIKARKPLLEALSGADSEIMMSKSEIHSSNYHLVSSSLRDLANLETKLSASNIDRSLPTLFISECVLVYIETEHTNKLIKWIADNFPTAMFINYEQVNMEDSFGQVMIENLRARDCVLSGVGACASLDTQMNRFLTNNWTGGDALDMGTVYRCLPQDDVQRMEKLELMDERELLDQLLSHYCLVWAFKDASDVGLHSLSLS